MSPNLVALVYGFKKYKVITNKMAQWAKVIAINSDTLGSVPKIYMLQERTDSCKLFSDLRAVIWYILINAKSVV